MPMYRKILFCRAYRSPAGRTATQVTLRPVGVYQQRASCRREIAALLAKENPEDFSGFCCCAGTLYFIKYKVWGGVAKHLRRPCGALRISRRKPMRIFRLITLMPF